MGERGNREDNFPPEEIPGERGPEKGSQKRITDIASKKAQVEAKARSKPAPQKASGRKKTSRKKKTS